ncbi:hypothetical protein C3D80_09590 [Cronobacter sakazakii]|uniref:Uncharacterized protein n=1 Tax=Cronobacter sakazakii (strain ATCC BAA-894) TaxID=290339 RepID=A7MHZ8_CROS8|nr:MULTISPECIES: hypothetical protein [Cronobacter]ABU75884.1 hypothetical protein ESA_00600 [Cronobacter sakazakii ATCC BAA-894]AXX03206.1 hypothetical protein CsakCS09_15090 [Cronobacter sakazakii]EGT4323813.1 hypothetical protein [Cronobacter sakazakii]EGT4952038.1 hypothetical protein [Cronobacter sakazakii]EGT5666339.1 hypothetical protein [Cronobacter sakazakii]
MDAINDVLYQVERGIMALVREGDLRKKLRRFWFESLIDISPAALPEALQRELHMLRAPFSAVQARPVALWSENEVQQWLKAVLGFYHRLSEQAFRENAGQKM